MSNFRKTTSPGIADFVWESDDTVLTAHLKTFNGQMVASLWATRLFSSGFVHLVLAQEMPIRAQSEKEALSELGSIVRSLISPTLLNAREPAHGYQMRFIPEKDEREDIAVQHLKAHAKSRTLTQSDSTVIFETAKDYVLLVEFGISNPSSVIAKTKLLRPKSIQQRIYLARESGILQSHGQGRTTSLSERRSE